MCCKVRHTCIALREVHSCATKLPVTVSCMLARAIRLSCLVRERAIAGIEGIGQFALTCPRLAARVRDPGRQAPGCWQCAPQAPRPLQQA